MSFAIARLASASRTLIAAWILAGLGAVATVLWFYWAAAGDPTLHTELAPAFYQGRVMSVEVKSGIPWLVALTPLFMMASFGGAAACFYANHIGWHWWRA